MKTRAISAFRSKLSSGRATCGLWVTLESPALTEMAVALGLDWVVVDAEHSALGWPEIAAHLRAAARSPTVAFVRLPEHNAGSIKRALDLGADGVAIPGVETAAQLEEIVRDCRYPPAGRRGLGADRATAWGHAMLEHTSEANAHVLVLPILESPRALHNMRELCAVDGADLFYFGPADYSAAAGHPGHWEGPGVAEDLLDMLRAVRAAGKQAGIIGTGPDDLLRRRDQGFSLLGLGTDAGLTLRALRDALRSLGADRVPAASLDPRDSVAAPTPLSRIPGTIRPDRPEVVTAPGQGRSVALPDGAQCELLVGDATAAKGLSTGVLRLDPGARLPVHTRPCSEAITVLVGEIDVAVEDRLYRLRPGDNILVPRWLPRSIGNAGAIPATAHVAFAMPHPERRDIDDLCFETRRMPDDAAGQPGAEHVTRGSTAARYAAGPNTEFIDFFNANLVAGIEISGGWGRFQPGGRLPAHFHDFDESICIIEGTATCRVNSRRYEVSGGATAFVPRGRPHYFVNDTAAPMEMIWVYAGPLPERIVVAEECLREEERPSAAPEGAGPDR